MQTQDNLNQSSIWSKNLIFACIANFLYFRSFYVLLPILPQYVASLGGTASQIGLVIRTFTLLSVMTRPYFGKLIDTYGRKKFMMFGAGLFSILFAVYGQIQTILPLCLLRAAHGAAHSSYMAASFAYVTDLAPPNRRGQVMGIYGVSNVVAMALFPALGSAIISHTKSFPMLFIFSTVLAAGSFSPFVLFMKYCGRPAREEKRVSLQRCGNGQSWLLHLHSVRQPQCMAQS